MATINLDLTAPKINIVIDFRGSHEAKLWQFERDTLGGLTPIDITGYSARFLAYSDCNLDTTALMNKTIVNGELVIVPATNKTMIIDGENVVFPNAYAFQVNFTNAEATILYDLEEGLHFVLYANAPANPERVIAKGTIKAKGIC